MTNQPIEVLKRHIFTDEQDLCCTLCGRKCKIDDEKYKEGISFAGPYSNYKIYVVYLPNKANVIPYKYTRLCSEACAITATLAEI